MSLLCVEFDFRCKSLNGILKEDLQSGQRQAHGG